MMPTTEDNARAIARAKGYGLDWLQFEGEGRRIAAIDPLTTQVLGAADDWPAALRLVMSLPRLGAVGDRLAGSMAEIQAELERRDDDDPRAAT